MIKKIVYFFYILLNLRSLYSSDLFDKVWYLEHNPDIRRKKVNPYFHYLRYGGFEGRDPSENFSSHWYLTTYKDVKKLKMNPLIHFLRYGKNEGRKPKPDGGPKRVGKQRIIHLTSQEELDIALIRESGMFDEEMYLENNPDVVQARMDPIYHYLRYGGRGRDVLPHFYTQWYLDTYEDVKNSGMNPLIHYLKYGRDLGYQPEPPTFPLRKMYDYAKETNSIIFEDTPERVFLRRPNVIGAFSGELKEGHALCPPAYVSVIEDATIFGGVCLVLSKEGIVLNDEFVDFSSEDFSTKTALATKLDINSIKLAYKGKPNLSVARGIFLSGSHDANYFHWLVECLPKLLLVDELKIDKDIPILVQTGLHKNLLLALEKVNVNHRSLIHIDHEAACQVGELIYPSPLSHHLGRKRGIATINDTILSSAWLKKTRELLKDGSNLVKKPWRKLFLARKKTHRYLENQELMISLLLEKNFEVVETDQLSFSAQVELFSQASMVVAPTGAALVNMMFCQPNTKVIIFMPEHETTNYYFWTNLGYIFNLNVRIIAGERILNTHRYYSIHSDYKVDPDLVLNEIV